MGGLGVGAQRPLPAGRGDNRGQLVISLGHRAQLCRIGGDGRIGQACFEIGMLLLDRSKAVGKLIRHSSSSLLSRSFEDYPEDGLAES